MSTRLNGSSNNGSYFYVEYTVVGQSVSGNWSDVSWTAGVHWGSFYFYIHDAGLTVSTTTGASAGGSSTGFGPYNSGWPISGAGTNRDYAFWGGTTRIFHNSNGDANVKFVGSAWWDTPGNFTSQLNSAVTLPHINRLSNAPSTPILSAITSTSVHVVFSDGSGGATIDSRQIGYGTSNSGPTTTISSTGSTTVTGLTPGTKYYFWARTHNSAGYSPWSAWASATTLRVPDPPAAPIVTDLTQTSLTATTAANADGGSAITAYQFGYGTDSVAPTSTTSVGGLSSAIASLLPGTKYYFWARAQNSVGWSPWSMASTATTIAGAWVKVGAVWKPAVPYVKVGGIWKLARPWVRSSGIWKETS